MHRTLATFIALAGFGSSGCLYDLDSSGYFGEPYGTGESALAVQEPVLEGQAGDVTVSEPTTARVHSAYRFDDQISVDIRTRGRGGVLMQNYTIDGFDRLAPGDEVVVSGAEPYVATGDSEPDVDVYTVGCSGPRDGEWEFDQGADEVTLQVEEGPEPGTLRLNFTSRFESYYEGDAQTVQGSVVVRVD